MSLRSVDVAVEVFRCQNDRLGYTFCGDHADELRGGTVYEIPTRDALRSAETDAPPLWTCDRCGRFVADWPQQTVIMKATIEHTNCRIF